MVRLTENNRTKPIINMIGDITSNIKPNDFISEKNSNFNMVIPVPEKTIKVLK